MKGILVIALLLLAGMNSSMFAQKIIRSTLVFKGIRTQTGNWQLWFADKNKNAFYFNAKRSYTEPYVFYSTGADGSIKENVRIKGSWFLVSYRIVKVGKTTEKIITNVGVVAGEK